MEAAISKPSRAGTSRFSKALPAPPPIHQDMQAAPRQPFQQAPRRHDQQPLQNTQSLSRKPLPSSGPLVLSVNEATMPKSLDSPLPSPPGPAHAPTTIPRRPVGRGNPPSPSDSSPLSSILSAYSNRSSDSTMRSSTDGAVMSAKGPLSPTLAKQDNGALKANHHELFLPTQSPLSMDDYVYTERPSDPSMPTAGNESKPAPPPPPKDPTINHQMASLTHPGAQEGSMQAAPATTPAAQSAPSESQIWRRRSTTVDKKLAVPELKLASSHGSTASSALPASPAPPAARAKESTLSQEEPHQELLAQAADTRVQLPASPHPAFPGRDIRPVASRQQIASKTPESMVHEISNSNAASEISNSPRGGIETASLSFPEVPNRNPSRPNVSEPTKPLQVARLPTPEYESGDIRSPMAETIKPPVSPSSSPELRTEAKAQPRVAPQDLRRLETQEDRPMRGKAALGGDTVNSPRLNANPSPSGLVVRSPIGLPSSPAANRGLPSDRNVFPIRTSSKAVGDRRPQGVSDEQEMAVNRAETPDVKSQVPPEVGDTQPVSAGVSHTEVASDAMPQAAGLQRPNAVQDVSQAVPEADSDVAGREKPTKEDPDTDCVPTPTSEHGGWWDPIPEGTIFDSPPIVERNLRCLSRHRIMVQSRNTYYPVACQACHVKDTSIRYTCGSCWLRICSTCRNNLYKFGGNLPALMEHNEAVLVERDEEEHSEEARGEGRIEEPMNSMPTELPTQAPWIAA